MFTWTSKRLSTSFNEKQAQWFSALSLLINLSLWGIHNSLFCGIRIYFNNYALRLWIKKYKLMLGHYGWKRIVKRCIISDILNVINNEVFKNL